MRCLALAAKWSPAATSIRFVTYEVPEAIRVEIQRVGGTVVDIGVAGREWISDAEATLAVVLASACDILLVDSYSLDERWERALFASVGCLVAIDDLTRDHQCDVLIDQNVLDHSLNPYLGCIPAGALALLGPKYALLREEFASEHARASARAGVASRIVVSFGGSDPGDWTSRVVEALASLRLKGAVITVIIGSLHAAAQDVINKCKFYGMDYVHASNELSRLMREADIGIGAGGITLWERCCVGLPSVVISIAENQSEQVAAAARVGLVKSIGDAFDNLESLASELRSFIANEPARSMMSRAGLQAVDGLGTGRVIESILRSTLRIRRATLADMRHVFEWRNDESIRSVSRSSEPISWDEHEVWYRNEVQCDSSVLLIGEVGSVPVGVVRFECGSNAAEVSIYLVPGCSGPARGSRLLRSGERYVRQFKPDVTSLRAVVVGSNSRSEQFFLSHGYVLQSGELLKEL
jgi:UDP-2,4-diacetamido-2,4,6-trideoxy-beta-L-altropyranose hydrolase